MSPRVEKESLVKKVGPWLALIGSLLGLIGYVTGYFVGKEMYLMNQQTQDREIYQLQDSVKELDQRIDGLEKAR